MSPPRPRLQRVAVLAGKRHAKRRQRSAQAARHRGQRAHQGRSLGPAGRSAHFQDVANLARRLEHRQQARTRLGLFDRKRSPVADRGNERGIHADRDGTVAAVHVVPGAQIDAKDLLVEIA